MSRGLMPKRTTVLLDDDVYERLVSQSVKRYGSPKAISKVLNEELRKLAGGEERIIELLSSRKIARTTTKEFEEYRRGLSKRFEH